MELLKKRRIIDRFMTSWILLKTRWLDFLAQEKREAVGSFLKRYFILVYEADFDHSYDHMGKCLPLTERMHIVILDEDSFNLDSKWGKTRPRYPDAPYPLSATPAFFAAHELAHVLDSHYFLSDRDYDIAKFFSRHGERAYLNELRFPEDNRAEAFASLLALYICSTYNPPLANELYQLVQAAIGS